MRHVRARDNGKVLNAALAQVTAGYISDESTLTGPSMDGICFRATWYAASRRSRSVAARRKGTANQCMHTLLQPNSSSPVAGSRADAWDGSSSLCHRTQGR